MISSKKMVYIASQNSVTLSSTIMYAVSFKFMTFHHRDLEIAVVTLIGFLNLAQMKIIFPK